MKRFGSPGNRPSISPTLSSQFDENAVKFEKIDNPDQAACNEAPAAETGESNLDEEKAVQQRTDTDAGSQDSQLADGEEHKDQEDSSRLANKTKKAKRKGDSSKKQVLNDKAKEENPGSSQTLNQVVRSAQGKASHDGRQASRGDDTTP